LVSKVHRQAQRLIEAGRRILFIGHAGHPEVIGTFGQVPEGTMTLIETAADAEAVMPADPDNLAFLTQTTLSVDDEAVVDDFVAHVDRRAEPLDRQFDDLDRPVDACAEAARCRDEDAQRRQ
jgi:4-hydroxy-3-methylbut-2-enyl diphosphate reductase